MKKLVRNLAVEPAYLKNLCHKTHVWGDVGSKKKKAIWRELDKFQGGKCVYCESVASRGNQTGHIEHFFDRNSFDHFTFDWNNLFGCCASTHHCGHYKDQVLPSGVRRSYDHNLLIKADLDDPEKYFQFLPDGKVIEKNGIPENMSKKAKETIRALRLDAPSLNQSRREHIKRYKDKVTAILNFLESGDKEIIESAMVEYYKIKKDAATAEYQTAIKHAVSWL